MKSADVKEGGNLEIPPDLITELAGSKNTLVLTGAGVSAESGISTFRDAQKCLWAKYRPEDLATPEAFGKNPEKVWQWYQWRRRELVKVEPNPAHYALTALQQRLPKVLIVTQNVDGLHQRAGSEDVIELHGSLMENICSITGKPLGQVDTDLDYPPPSNLHPAGLTRPGVVWFGEALPEVSLNAAWEAAKHCDFCLSIGTSGLVEPAASLPRLAKSAGACLAEINIESTPLSSLCDWSLRGLAGQLLLLVLTELEALPEEL